MNIGLLLLILLVLIALLIVGLILANRNIAVVTARAGIQADRILDQNYRLCQLLAPGPGVDRLHRHEEKLAELAAPPADGPLPHEPPEPNIDELLKLRAPDSSAKAING